MLQASNNVCFFLVQSGVQNFSLAQPPCDMKTRLRRSVECLQVEILQHHVFTIGMGKLLWFKPRRLVRIQFLLLSLAASLALELTVVCTRQASTA